MPKKPNGARSAHEIERKFDVLGPNPRSDLDRLYTLLRAHPNAGLEGTKSFDRVYWDEFVPEKMTFKLYERGIGVRLQEKNKSGKTVFQQTTKTIVERHADGTIDRMEEKAIVKSLTPDLSKIFSAEAVPLIQDVHESSLVPVVIQKTPRRLFLWSVHDGNMTVAQLEIAFDSGVIETTSGRSIPVNQIEMEIKARHKDLDLEDVHLIDQMGRFILDLAAQEGISLQLQTLSKLEQGMAEAMKDPSFYTAQVMGIKQGSPKKKPEKQRGFDVGAAPASA